MVRWEEGGGQEGTCRPIERRQVGRSCYVEVPEESVVQPSWRVNSQWMVRDEEMAQDSGGDSDQSSEREVEEEVNHLARGVRQAIGGASPIHLRRRQK